jgi:eukaryotic-like serine/threonine-protein kinase
MPAKGFAANGIVTEPGGTNVTMGSAGLIACPQCGSTNPAGTFVCPKCKTPFDVPTMVAEHTDLGNTPYPGSGFGGGEMLVPGSFLGDRYEILQLLGEGGMGSVYKAQDRELDRVVALKVIRPDLARKATILERFKQEIILSQKVTHKNVIRIYDLGLAGGTKFISMDFIDGQDVWGILRKAGKLEPREAARIIRDVCLGLEAAHSEGVVHRDLKPQNIMMDERGNIVVMDFGIAGSVEDSTLTKSGTLMGTPTYMSPEQAKGDKVDARSDLFAVGVILYELLTGKVPFQSDTLMGQLLKRVQEKPVPPIELEPGIPAPINTIVLKCLQADLNLRYQNAAAIRRDLDAWLDPESVGFRLSAPLSTPVHQTWKWITAAIAVVALIAAGIVTNGILSRPPVKMKPVSMLIADFANTTGDPVFDGTIEPMFSIAMEGASFITSYNRAEAHRISAQLNSNDTKMDQGKAQLVAARQGVNVVIGGDIAKQGNEYRITVRAVDAVTGKEITSQQATTSKKKEVLSTIGKLAAPVRKALGDASPESARLAAAETFSAGSIEASHQYAVAQDFQFAARWDDAIQAYTKAIQMDPTLGRAYAGLAVVHANLGQRDAAAKYFQQAMAHIDRMTDREKYRTRASYYLAVRNIQSAIEELTTLVQQYPADSAGLNNLSVAYSYRRDMTKASEYARRAVDIYPKNALPRMNLAAFAMYGGDFQTAEQETRTVLQINPQYAKAYIVLGLTKLADGKPKEAAEAYQKAESLSPRGASFAANGLADLAIYEGRLKDAAAILEKSIAADEENKSPGTAATKLTTLAYTRLLLGQRGPAVAALDQAMGLSKQEEVLIAAARVYLLAGQEAKARAIAADLASKLGQDFQAYAKVVLGEIELQKGNPREAINLFKASLTLSDSWLGRFDLARAYLNFNAFTEADSELSQCLKRKGEATAIFLDEVPTYRYYPPVHYYIGRALDGLQSAGAKDAYRTFLSLQSPESEHPLAADAKRRQK